VPHADPEAGPRFRPDARGRGARLDRHTRGAAGKYKIPAHVVTYTAKGVLYRQRLTLSAYGSVADKVPRDMLAPGEARCIGATGTTILSGFRR
jgi:hypothetical protein